MTRRRRKGLDGEADYGDERMFESSPKLRVKPYHDCPTCPYCASRAGVGAAAYGQTDPKTLKCLYCGEYFQGTAEQIEQARRADLAWERRENNERGPRSVVLRRRRRRETNQLSLAWTDQVVAAKEDSGDDR